MPQISTIGTGGTYTTLAAWAAAEGGADYGAGNPAVGEFLELINESVAITGVFVRGYILRAASGLELDKSDLSAAVGNAGDIRPNISTNGALCLHKDIKINSSIIGTSTDLQYENCAMFQNFSAGTKNVLMLGTVHIGMSRALDATRNNAGAIAINCTAIDNTGTFAYVRFKCTNCLTISNSASGFAAATAGSDYNAASGNSAPGPNSLQNRTTADLVDYAGGDYRTAASSVLSTAGEDGTFIGFGVEAAAAGVTIDGAVTLPSLVFTGSATDSTSETTANGAITLPSLTFAGSATDSTSETTANGAITLPSLVFAGSATDSSSETTANGAITLPSLTFTGSATDTTPQIIADGAATLPSLTFAGIATDSTSETTANGAITLPSLTFTGSATAGRIESDYTIIIDVSVKTIQTTLNNYILRI